MSVLKSLLTLMGANYSAKDYDSKFTKGESAIALYKREAPDGKSYALQSSLTSKGVEDQSPDIIPREFQIDHDAFPMDRGDHFVAPVVLTAVSNSVYTGKSQITDGKSERFIVTTIPVGTNTDEDKPETKRTISNAIKGPRSILQFRMDDRGLTSEKAQARIKLTQYVADALESVLDTEPEHTRQEAVRKARSKLESVEGATAFLEGLNELWKKAIQEHSMETSLHVGRVTELTTMLADGINKAQSGPMEAIKIEKAELKLLKLSAALHDLGKLYTPITILDSGIPVPGSRHELGGYDRQLMERHAQDVYDVLDIPGMKIIGKVRDIAGAHHLHASGKGGYPKAVLEALNAKKGVPFEAKLLMVADVVEALTAEREYRGGNGLPLSTSLNIMFAEVNKGMIDPQIFRFAIESGIFDAYAEKYSSANGKHIKPYDSELLEKLGYSSEHLAAAKKLKEEFASKTGVSMQGLDSFLRMPFSVAEEKAKEVQALREQIAKLKASVGEESGLALSVIDELMAAKPDERKDKLRELGLAEDGSKFSELFVELMDTRKKLDKRDEDFPKPEFAVAIYDMKSQLLKELNPDDAPKYVRDDEPFPTKNILTPNKKPYEGAFVMKADQVYIDKIMAMSAKDADNLNALKNTLVKTVMGKDEGDPDAKRALEDMVKWHIAQNSSLLMGIRDDKSQQMWKDNKDKLIDALSKIETDSLAATKKRILDAIPVAPLSGWENLTLFTPRREIKRTPAQAAVGG